MLERMITIGKSKDYLMKVGMLLLIEIFLAVTVWVKGGNGDAYLSILIPQLLLFAVVMVLVFYFDSSQVFTFCCCILLMLGIAVQCIIQSDGQAYVKKESVILFLSLIMTIGFILFYTKLLPRFNLKYMMLAAVIFAVCVYLFLLLFGTEKYGTKAWFVAGPISLQPTEFIKITSVIFFSALFCESRFSDKQKLLYGCLYMALNMMFSVLIREMGSFLLLGMIFLIYCILFLESTKLLIAFGGIMAALGAAGASVLMLVNLKGDKVVNAGGKTRGLLGKLYPVANNIVGRFEIWINPLDKSKELGAGYQGMRARAAMSLGGLLGSNHKISVPVAESDFVFVSILLYMGYLVAAMIIILFVILLVLGIKMYLRAEGDMETGLIAGSVFYIVLQSFIMIFGSTGFFIMTGVPISFLSYGGTATMTVFMFSALILYLSSSDYRDIFWKTASSYERREKAFRKKKPIKGTSVKLSGKMKSVLSLQDEEEDEE